MITNDFFSSLLSVNQYAPLRTTTATATKMHHFIPLADKVYGMEISKVARLFFFFIIIENSLLLSGCAWFQESEIALLLTSTIAANKMRLFHFLDPNEPGPS